MKVYGIGRLTRDAELSRNVAALAIVTFTLAWNTGKENSHFVRCVALGKTGEAIANYTKKGDRIFINNGELQEVRFTNDKGEEVRYHEVLINSFQFIEPKDDDPQVEAVEKVVEVTDDDLPF